MNTACERMIANIETIGTAPTITLRIMQEVKKTDADFSNIARIIMGDQRITAQVLKVADAILVDRGYCSWDKRLVEDPD